MSDGGARDALAPRILSIVAVTTFGWMKEEAGMIDRRHMLRTVAALAAAGIGGHATATDAHEYKVGALQIEHPWLRAPREGQKSTSLFMVISNKSDRPERLIGVKAATIGSAEAHVAPQFAERADAIFLPPQSKVTLAPGGSYVELLDISKMNPVGWGYEMTLSFERAGEVMVDASIEAPDATHAHDAEALERWQKARGEASAEKEQEHRSSDPDGAATPVPDSE